MVIFARSSPSRITNSHVHRSKLSKIDQTSTFNPGDDGQRLMVVALQLGIDFPISAYSPRCDGAALQDPSVRTIPCRMSASRTWTV